MRYLIALLAAFSLPSLHAETLEAPQGPVILTVSGELENTNAGDRAQFDRAMLEALPQHETVTHTPWHDGAVSFVGPLGRTLLDAVGSEGRELRIMALNDYSATVPVRDFYKYDVIFAMSANGQPLQVRDQGPLFVIYPFDQASSLMNEVTLSRSVWQVNRIEIE